MSQSTPNPLHHPKTTPPPPDDQTEPLGTPAEREAIRVGIAKVLRERGEHVYNAAWMESAIDNAIRQRRTKANGRNCGRPASALKPAVQQAFIGADDASKQTRRAAATANSSRRSTTRDRIVEAIEAAGYHGRTADELAIELELPAQTVSAAVSGLKKNGHVVTDGRTRTTRLGSPAAVLTVGGGNR